MAIAKIDQHNGEGAIFIDGKPFPPMIATICSKQDGYYARLAKAGIRLFFVEVESRWNKPGSETEVDGVTETLQKIDQILSVNPDAYIVLRLCLNPSAQWISAHPEELILYNDKKHHETAYWGPGKCEGMFSFASEVWRRESAEGMLDYLAELSQYPCFERVCGVFLCAGGTAEWYYPGDLSEQGENLGIYADFSKPFLNFYSRFLREKYGTVENLCRVWGRPDADFDNPPIPDMDARAHIHRAHNKILDSLRVFFSDMKRLTADNGDFVTRENLFSLDFFAAFNEATADAIVHFASALKAHYPNLLAGAFYGYFGCTDFYGASHNTGTLRILDSGVVDFLSAPNVYTNHEPGGVAVQREMQDSLRIRNMICISEDDFRTHRSQPDSHRLSMHLYGVEDSITILKRGFARDLCEEIQGWWFDMGAFLGTSDWYDDPQILSLFAQQQEIARFAYTLDRKKKNEIALVYDTESVHLTSMYTDKMVLELLRTSDLHRIGAPIDYYFHNDLSNPATPDYKLYVMINCYHLTDAEREAVVRKARRNHATVLWLYAPGYVNPDADAVMDLHNIEKTVGMRLSQYEGTIFPNFRIDTASHRAVARAKGDREYGFIDRNVHCNVWMNLTELELPFVNPAFSVVEEEGVQVLGRYCADGKVAYALKEQDGYTSAYCATQVIRSDLIASLASYAGCHIYTEDEDVFFANENFVCIHASYTGTHRITFKAPCTPYEVYEKRAYGENVTSLELSLKLGETKMFYLK